jgi:hypothetical protein
MSRQYRAGQSVEDHCRQCHEDRIHTVIVVDAHAQPLRVSCDFCRSEHNYRGGPRNTPRAAEGAEKPVRAAEGAEKQGRGAEGAEKQGRGAEGAENTARASEGTERPSLQFSSPQRASVMNQTPIDSDLEATIRRIIREETGLTPVAPAEKWRGGHLVLRPGKPGVQEKTVPIDSFFNKIVMLRNRLRTLEQQLNASELPDDQKLKLQGYITGCYGSLTSFNVLFAADDDKFVGSGGGD